MNELIRKVVYFILSIQEKALTMRLDKSLKGSYKNKTSKTIIAGSEHMTLTSETEKNKELVRKNVEDILKNCENNPYKLLEYVEAAGTKVLKLTLADKVLQTIGEEEGFISELIGLKALYLNLYTKSGFSFKSKPIFIIRNGNGTIDPLFLIHHFYKWYAMKMNLPGFDYKSQQYFKKYLKDVNTDMTALSLEDMLCLQEAINRDQEATAFCLELTQRTEGAKKVQQKMHDGGASI